MSQALIAQIIGFIGTGFMVISFQFKKNRTLFALQICSNLATMLHFLMLGAYTGCINIGLGILRSSVLCARGRWAKWKGWKWVIVALFAAATVLTWKDGFSVLPFIGMASYTLGAWTRNRKTLRLASLLVSSPAWLAYDIYARSWSGIVCELISMGSVVISILRYGWKALDTVET